MKSVKQANRSIRESLLKLSGMLCALAVPVLGYSQPAPPPGSGGSGTSPDTPLSVPFHADMNIAFALVGVIFAVIVLWKMQTREKTSA